MQYPYTSIFPEGIDERTFFHDVDLGNKTVMETYNGLIQDSKYTDANIFLSQQSGIHSYSADLFNYIEAKINTWQQTILEKEKYNPYHYSSSDPDISVGEFWID